jgi:heme exporter protein CcmD
MSGHAAFIFAAYAITALVVLGAIGAVVSDHISLRRALAKFPARDGETRDHES